MTAPKSYKLGGLAAGTIRDNGAGTASYFRTLEFRPALQVRIADVTGFALSSGRLFRILGHGAELASAVVSAGAPARIEAWFRAHPDFGASAPAQAADQAASAAAGTSFADELVKLAGLRDTGVLAEDEFAAQKAKLLG
jgi:hypothetical protein